MDLLICSFCIFNIKVFCKYVCLSFLCAVTSLFVTDQTLLNIFEWFAPHPDNLLTKFTSCSQSCKDVSTGIFVSNVLVVARSDEGIILDILYTGTQALVRAGSNHSSLSAEENIELSPVGRSLLVPQLLCRARALVDFIPNIYEKDALRYKVRYHNNKSLPLLNNQCKLLI